MSGILNALVGSFADATARFFTITSSRRQWRGVAFTSAGIYAAGDKGDDGQTGIITRFNYNGTVNWQRIYRVGSNPGNTFLDIASDSSGNIYVVGNSGQSNNLRPFIARINPANGDFVWQRWINNSGTLRAIYSLKIDSSNRIWTVWMEDDFWHLIQWDTNGSLVNNRAVSGMTTGNNRPVGPRLIDFRSNGNIVFGGNSVSVEKFGTLYVTRYSESTTSFTSPKSWTFGAGGTEGYYANNLFVGNSDTMSLAGTQQVNGRAFVSNMDLSANPPTVAWTRQVGSAGYFGGVARDSSGNIYAVGGEGIVTRWNSSGTLQWQRAVTISGVVARWNACFVDNSTNLLYAVGTNGSENICLIAAFPLDGSGTGTYSAGGITAVYAASSFTVLTPTVTTGGFSPSYISRTIFNDTAGATADTWAPSNTRITY